MSTSVKKVTFKEMSDAIIENKFNNSKIPLTLTNHASTQTQTTNRNHQTTQTGQMTSFKISNGKFTF